MISKDDPLHNYLFRILITSVQSDQGKLLRKTIFLKQERYFN